MCLSCLHVIFLKWSPLCDPCLPSGFWRTIPFLAHRVCSPPTPHQAIFFGGIDPSIRGEVWPFLLHYYSYDSTSQEREAWRLQKRTHSHDIQQRRWGSVCVCVCRNMAASNLCHENEMHQGIPRVYLTLWKSIYVKASDRDPAGFWHVKRQINCHMAAVSAAKCSASQTWNHMWVHCGFFIAGAEQSIGTIREVLRGGAGREIKGLWRKNMSVLIRSYSLIKRRSGTHMHTRHPHQHFHQALFISAPPSKGWAHTYSNTFCRCVWSE